MALKPEDEFTPVEEDPEQPEAFIQRNVYEPVTWKDYVEKERDKIPLAQRESDQFLVKFLIILCLSMFVLTQAQDFARGHFNALTRYQGSTGTYLVDGDTKTIHSPDGSICTYDRIPYQNAFEIIYPNGFRVTVTPVGRGGGITTYDSDNQGELTPYMESTHLDLKNAMLTHLGFTPEISAGKFLALPFLILGFVCLFYPYKIGDIGTFLYIMKSQQFHSSGFYKKVQGFGVFILLVSFVTLLS